MWSLLVAGAAALSGCTTHSCDPTTVDAGGGTVLTLGSGTLAWESRWVDYPGNVTVNFAYPPGFRCPLPPTPYLATAPDGGGQVVLASGYLALFTDAGAGGVSVTNGTCAEYYLQLVAEAPASGCGGGGSASDAGATGADL